MIENNRFGVGGLAERVRRLADQAERTAMLEPALRMSLRLREALTRLENDDPTAAVIQIMFLGGTGAGKSTLFNALVGRPEASPTSSGVGCFTRRPFVAASPRNRPLLRVPEGLNPEYVSEDLEGIALIDAPDVDGVLRENWRVTRRLLENADVVVYVTTPDRRADFRLVEELREWAPRKRWLFVLNKADQAPTAVDEIRADWDRRLKEQGFEPNDNVRFVVCANDPDGRDFPRLRKVLLEGRMSSHVRVLRADAFVGWSQYALDREIVDSLRETLTNAKEHEVELDRRVKQIYHDCFSQRAARDAFGVVVGQQAWRYLSEQVGGLMGAAIAFRCRLALWSVAYHLGRLGTGRFSPWGVVRAAAAVVSAVLRGAAPVFRILSAVGPLQRERLRAVENDARRIVSDLSLDDFAVSEAVAPHAERNHGDSSDAPTSTDERLAAADWLRRLTAGFGDDFQTAHLQTDVENLAQKLAREVGHWLPALLANVLPTLFLLHVTWRLGYGWWREAYPPWEFYGAALALFALTFAPGFILLSYRMRRRSSALSPNVIIEQINEPLASAPLRRARVGLERFLDEAESLRGMLAATRRQFDEELSFAAPAWQRNGSEQKEQSAPRLVGQVAVNSAGD